MSYILDALKKAEAERQLGRAPDIHSQPAMSLCVGPAMPAGVKVLAWAGSVLALLVALIFWWWSRQHDAAPPPLVASAGLSESARSGATNVRSSAMASAEATTEANTEATASARKPEATPAAAAPVAPALAEPASASAVDHEAEASPLPKHAPVRKASPALRNTAPVQRSGAPAAASAATAAASSAMLSPTAAGTSAADARQTPALALAALPPQIRKEIPAINITGFLYAGSRSERSILIDNRLLHEGDQVASGLVLEEMQPSEAIFSFRGYRFRAPYR
jgi:general secretion pathway protein B